MPNKNSASVSEWFQDILIIIFLRWKLLVLTTIATAIITLVFTFILPPLFVGHFSIIMRGSEQDAQMIQPGQGYRVKSQAIDMAADEERLLNSLKLSSQALSKIKDKYPDAYFNWIRLSLSDDSAIKKIVGQLRATMKRVLGAQETRSISDPLIDALHDSVVVTPVIGSHVIEVEMRHSNPAFLKDVLQTYLDTYMNIREELWMATSAPDFFKRQADHYFNELVQINQQLSSVKEKSRVVNSQQEMAELQQEANDLRGEISNLDVDIAGLKNYLYQLDHMNAVDLLPAAPFQDVPDESLSSLRESLGRAVTERAGALKYFDANSLNLKRIDKEILELSGNIRKNLTLSAKQQLNAKQHRLGLLKQKRSGIIDQLLKIDKAETQIAILQEKAAVLKENANLYETKNHETRISLELRNETFSNVAVLTPPYVAAKPLFPQRPILLILSLFVGLFLGICAAVLLEMMDDSFKLPKHIEKVTGLPVLASFLADTPKPDLQFPLCTANVTQIKFSDPDPLIKKMPGLK
jgi:uncharacterized protein involved in exopolysaccharide biosynthesis